MNSESLISYIHQIMNSDGPLRKDLESQLLFLSKSNPLIYFQASIMLLYSSQTVPSDIRLFAILHLKKVFSDSSFQSQLNQVELLKEVSVLLKKEPNMQILGFISEFYGEIAGKLLKDFTLKNDSEGIITNDLLNNDVWELLSTNEEQKVVSGLMILIKLIEIGFEEFLTLFQENLFAIIKKMLTSPNDQIVKTVIKLIVKILTHVDYSLCKKYVPLIPDILEILFVLLNQKNIEVIFFIIILLSFKFSIINVLF